MHLSDRTHHVICECSSVEHTIRFIHDPEDREIYTEVFLWKYRFFKRLWVGIKYIFGYKSRYGHWDCTVMTHAQAVKLRDYLDRCVEESSLYGADNEY